MKVRFNKPPRLVIALRDAECGTVVMRFNGDGATVYVVANAYDGSGDHVLVTLAGKSTVKRVPQDTLVMPLDAELIVGDSPL